MSFWKIAFILLILGVALAAQVREAVRPTFQQAATQEPRGQEPFTVRITFGQRATPREQVTGSVSVEDARIAEITGWGLRPIDRINLNTFSLVTMNPRSREPSPPKGIRLRGASGPAGRIAVTTNTGVLEFRLADLKLGEEREYLDGDARVTCEAPAEKLTDDSRDDDYPSIAAVDARTAWAVWQSYSGLSDEIRISKYDAGWRTFTRVPGVSGDVWRPRIALDGQGRPWVVWAQQQAGNFDIYARGLDAKENRWLDLVRLSTHPQPDINADVTADGNGGLWVVWQGFHGNNSDIFLRHWDGNDWSDEKRVTENVAN